MANKKNNLIYCNDALQLKTSLEQGFIRLGEYLYTIKNERLYEANWASWEEYSLELKMSQNSINKLIQIYARFILSYGIPEEKVVEAGGWSVIAELLPVIETAEQAEEWLDKAKELTREDLRKEITEKKSGIPMQSCKHLDTYTITVCRGCGIKMEDHEDHD